MSYEAWFGSTAQFTQLHPFRMFRSSRRALSSSALRSSIYRYGPQDCIPKHVPRLDQSHKASNIRAMGENHGMRTRDIAKKRRDFLQRGVAQDDFARMKGEYGIISLTGFRLNHEHMKAMALAVNQFLNKPDSQAKSLGLNAYFRIPDPWQPVTKHPECATMGGGKGKIAYWVTPIRGFSRLSVAFRI